MPLCIVLDKKKKKIVREPFSTIFSQILLGNRKSYFKASDVIRLDRQSHTSGRDIDTSQSENVVSFATLLQIKTSIDRVKQNLHATFSLLISHKLSPPNSNVPLFHFYS